MKFAFIALFTSALGRNESTIAIFNNWKATNNPVLFKWEDGQKETSSIVKKFKNHDYLYVKWSCSGMVNGKMFIFGGQLFGTDPATNVYEITDCEISDTKIALPFAIQMASCATLNDLVYICASDYDDMEKNCTIFDGKKFENASSTETGHVGGAMAIFDGSPVILGGLVDQEEDTDEVEKLNLASSIAPPKWTQLPHLPAGRRLLSAVGIDNRLFVMGGYDGKTGKSVSRADFFDGKTWSSMHDMLTPRHGHRSIIYSHTPMTILHIGGESDVNQSKKAKLSIERWQWELGTDVYKPKMSSSSLVLDTYIDFPETFNVTDAFCK